MKKIMFLIFVIVVVCVYLVYRDQKKYTIPNVTLDKQSLGQELSPIPNQLQNSADIQYTESGIKYGISVLNIGNPENLSLHVNSDQKTTNEFKKLHNCSAIASAGFYDTDFKPLGLFVSNGTIVEPYRTSSLFNGIFSVKNSVPDITKAPVDEATLALQSGPQLYNSGDPLPLAIRNDEPSRRIVILTTYTQNVLLLAFYQLENIFSGPNLEDLPRHLEIYELQSQTPIKGALNLDGGSASSFDNNRTSLNELTSVGSFFCLN